MKITPRELVQRNKENKEMGDGNGNDDDGKELLSLSAMFCLFVLPSVVQDVRLVIRVSRKWSVAYYNSEIIGAYDGDV